MLDELHVENIALIEDADIEFSDGLTVLTGETGAGKTALLSALRLICGQRADSGVVRDGAVEACAEARFAGADEHIVRRRLTAAGRSRCTVDGAMATVAELARATSSIRVHSQHEQVQLLQESAQRVYLDSWISPDGAHLQDYRAARTAYLDAKAAYDELSEAQSSLGQQLEFMRFTAAEIAKVNPVEGEYERLEADVPRLQHAEQLASAVDAASRGLGDDGGVLDALADVLSSLQRQAGIDPKLDEICERLAGLLAELEDAARDLGSYGADVQFDPEALDQTMTRLDALSGLMKRFGPGMEQVFETWENARRAIERAEMSPEQVEEAKANLQHAQDAFVRAADELSELRHAKAREFCEQLAASVHELAMEDASFEFSFERLPLERWGETGPERVELLYCPSSAGTYRPLSRIASGGELSRILLALECMYHVTGQDSEDRTIVFDEVDSGIGGVTGTAVARRIAELAEHDQVIVVTHLPQVAAHAARHYVVTKESDAQGHPVTTVAEINGDARVAEIARMLAGSVDDTALAHAKTLLEDAGRGV